MTKDNLRRIQASPRLFRESLTVELNASSQRLGPILESWQRADFEAVDPGWLRVTGLSSEPAKMRAWLERPRGHSKTSDTALMAVWALFASRKTIRGICAASDRDQASLLRSAMQRLVDLNSWLGEFLDFTTTKVRNKHTGSELEFLTSDARSSFGHLVDFILLDEVCHWADRELFDSLLSAAAKKANCLLICISNAGFESSWQWDVREQIRTDEAWHFSRLDGRHASWISESVLAEQERLLPHIAFERLWGNKWASGSGDALREAEIDRAIVLEGETLQPEKGWAYFAGLDIGIRRDATALVVLGRHVGWRKPIERITPNSTGVVRALADLEMIETKRVPIEYEYERGTGQIRLVAVRVWKPSSGKPVDLAEIETEVLRLNERFNLSCIGADAWQAIDLTQRLRRAGIDAREVNSTGPIHNTMATNLLGAFHDQRIELFQHDDLIADLRNLRVVEKSYGVRLESPRTNSIEVGTVHGDCASALCYGLLFADQVRYSSNIGDRSLVYPLRSRRANLL